MRKTSVAQFKPRDLDLELGRRQLFPPHLLPSDIEQWISVADLRAEFATTPVTHPDYRWRRWELALAERQQRHQPDSLFYRIVTATDTIAIAG